MQTQQTQETDWAGLAYHSSDDFSEDYVFSVQPSSPGQQDVELGAIGVCAVVGHGYISRGAVTQDKLFIVESITVNTAT